MERIIVGVDGSAGSDLALLWAAEESERRGCPLDAVHADTAPGDRPGSARADLGQHLVAVLGPHRAAAVRLDVVAGRPGTVLVDASASARLLVVGGRGLGTFRGALLGSVSQHCLRHAACPVVVVPARDSHPVGRLDRIVVGYDGSTYAHEGVRWAAEEAVLAGAELDVIQTWHVPYVGGAPFAFGDPHPELISEGAADCLAECVAELRDVDLPAPPHGRLVEGSAALELVKASQGADLVVVGSRGLGGVAGALLGSISQHVTHRARCPVVVVPPPRRAPGSRALSRA